MAKRHGMGRVILAAVLLVGISILDVGLPPLIHSFLWVAFFGLYVVALVRSWLW